MRFRFCFILFLCAAQVLDAKKYKVKLASVEKCKIPEGKADKTEPVIYDTVARKINRQTSVIKTNFTILRPTGPFKMNFRIYNLQQSGSKDLVFKLERVDCQNPFSYQLLRVINFKMDNDCVALPGNYLTDNINLQDFAWVLTKAMVSPGKYIYDLEFYTEKGGVAACNTIIVDISETK